MRNARSSRAYHVMMLPAMLLLLIFSIAPMSGIVIAFEKFVPAKGIFGSKWVGLNNFKYMFSQPDSWQVLSNTVIIAVSKIVLNLVVPVIVALLLNEIRSRSFKRAVQTIIYLPHFLSWVILGGILTNVLSLDGIVNRFLQLLGMEPVLFLASNATFRPVIIITDVWKEFGFGSVIYLAAITGINETLYEAAEMDGANRLQRVLHVTLPGIMPTVVLMATLSLGNVLNAGFEQIFTLYNPMVYSTGDIIDTYVHRTGLVNAQYGLATAVGLLKSVVSMVLIAGSYKLAEKTVNYRIF